MVFDLKLFCCHTYVSNTDETKRIRGVDIPEMLKEFSSRVNSLFV